MATSGFNPASEQDVFSIEEPHQSISRLASTLTGQEARQFYEDLAKHEKEESGKMDKESKRKDRCKTRESKRRERHRAVAVQVNPSRTTESGGTSSAGRSGELQGLRLLRCAHQGDTSALKDLLSKGADVNFQDSFFWTALMCASWSGHRAAVRLLLERGAAWVGVVDLQGRDAGDLALEGIVCSPIAKRVTKESWRSCRTMAEVKRKTHKPQPAPPVVSGVMCVAACSAAAGRPTSPPPCISSVCAGRPPHLTTVCPRRAPATR